MHIVVRRYKIQPNSGQLLLDSIHNGFGPTIRTAQGFVSYNAFVNQDNELCSVGVFQNEASAEASNQLAREFIQKENLSSHFQGPPVISSGELGVHV
jgi:hypothetical protein